jgi:hypothetical protein
VTPYFPSVAGSRSAIAVAACLAIGGLVAVTAPETANKRPAISAPVTRAKKADQLPKSISKIDLKSRSVTTPPTATKRSALGCERVFSALADPAYSQLYRSCIV